MNSNLSFVFSQKIASQDTDIHGGEAFSGDEATDAGTDLATNAGSESTTLDLSVLPTAAVNDDDYEGINWQRLRGYHKPQDPPRRSGASWVWDHGYRIQKKSEEKVYWLCRYCHTQRLPGGLFVADLATTSAARHLKENKKGHGIDKNGPIVFAKPKARGASIISRFIAKGIDYTQQQANEAANAFSRDQFRQSVIDFIILNNQPLSVVEDSAFRAMLNAANPLADRYLWRSHTTLRAHVLAEYNAFVPSVINYLKSSRSLIHISFDNWTSTGGKHAITGICVHHLNPAGKPVDYVLGLPALLGAHSGSNVASIVSNTLKQFQIGQLDSKVARLGYFVVDNATNNDSAVAELAQEFKFSASQRRLRCACHILNLAAQKVLFGRDREAFFDVADLAEEERLLAEWRSAGPIGVLLDVISSIVTPQAIQLLAKYQRLEYDQLYPSYPSQTERDNETPPPLPPPKYRELQIVKPVKTRWNSFLAAFERAVELRNPLEGYIAYKTDAYMMEAARRRNPAAELASQRPRLFIAEQGLQAKDWATIADYINVLQPFKEATLLLEGRGSAGSSGAIWEVLPTFDWLITTLEGHIERLKEACYTQDPDSPEDHVLLNCQRALLKLEAYYQKLVEAPAYFIAAKLHPTYKDLLATKWTSPERRIWLTKGNADLIAAFRVEKARLRRSPPSSSEPPQKVARTSYSGRAEYLRASLSQANMLRDDEDELKRWDNEPILPENHPLALDPIQHWVSRAEQYPTLSKLALDILSIPASAADCERTFSELGDLLETRRLKMKPDILSALQSLRSWKRLGLQPSKSPPLRAPANESAAFCAFEGSDGEWD